jgi:tetratricopeptide (TPR) repeat protein
VLAVRPALKNLVDAATAKAVQGPNPDINAIRLRVAVLEAQERKPELVKFLTALVERSNSMETLEDLEGIATKKSLESVHCLALEREAVLTDDPVKRMQLHLELVGLFEHEKDVAAAQKIVDSLYSENPKILGVVRTAIDFYWRHGLHEQAIEVTLQAAHASYPDLKTQFTFEAARKMTEARQYEEARKLLQPLMEASPYNEEYLAATAETYSRAGDNAGLRDFYLQKIALFRKAKLPDQERTDRIAALRRGLIPALTTLKDYTGAIDQYIEILNRYPEDDALTTEVAVYAQQHGRQEQLLKFYSKTMAESYKDVSWPRLLARLQTDFADYPGAIDSYTKAIKINPDGTDLLTSRADLDERLLRFDEAASDYARVYDLSYHDSQWMIRVAEIRARQGKADLAVQALKTAMIEGHPERATDYFAVAQRLEGWQMLRPAKEFMEKGISIAGNDLLADPQYHSGAQIYARMMTRLRDPETAYTTLQSRLQAAIVEPAPVQQLVKQIFKSKIEAATDEEMRKNVHR